MSAVRARHRPPSLRFRGCQKTPPPCISPENLRVFGLTAPNVVPPKLVPTGGISGAPIKDEGGIVSLTDLQARKAAPREKDYKLADSGGLYLFVTKKGFKSWRLKYRFADKEKRLVFGPYPEVTLAKAREERDRARALLREHGDPAVEERKRKMAAHAAAGATFERVATEWHEGQRARWSPVQAKASVAAVDRGPSCFRASGLLGRRCRRTPSAICISGTGTADGTSPTAGEPPSRPS